MTRANLLRTAHTAYLLRDFPAADHFATAFLDREPASVPALALRGRARRDGGNPDAAWQDFTRALELAPKCASVRGSRACLHFDLGLLAEALSDFERVLADREGAAEDYVRLRIALSRARLGDARPAFRDLRDWLRASPCVSSWTWSLAETLWNELPPGDLLKSASRPAESCEAGFWAGARLLIDHDRPAAVRAFRVATASPLWRFTEHRSASAELKRLGA